MNRFKRITAAFTLALFSVTLIAQTEAIAASSKWIAPASGQVSAWGAFASNTSNFTSMKNNQGYGDNLSLPNNNFTLIGSMDWQADPEDATKAVMRSKMLGADKWMRFGREEIGQAGIPSTEISDRINQFPKTAAYVFANYIPETAELIIEVQKVEKQPNGTINVYRADFTPWHGEWNKWRRDYLTPAEQLDNSKLGYNPFEQFKGTSKTDNVFHSISWEAAGVAIGEAMKRYDAHVAWIAADKTNITQKIKKSGGLLKKSVKVTTRGWAKPQWFVAMPMGMQPGGGVSAICVNSVGVANANGTTSSCDAPEHVAVSGVSIAEWKGGNMPEIEEMVYEHIYKKSGFTVLAFTILTFAVTWGIGSMVAGAVGNVGLAGGLSSLQIGLIGGGIYAGAMALNGAGLTTAQAGWAGSTGNGVLNINTGSMDKHQRGLVEGTRNKQIVSRVGTGLQGAQNLYSGNCPEHLTVAQCQASGLDAGTMHRSDVYAETNIPLQLVEREQKCWDNTTQAEIDLANTNDVEREKLRKKLQQCAAPADFLLETPY